MLIVRMLLPLVAVAVAVPALAAGPLANPGFEGSYVPYSGNAGLVTGAIAPDWSDNSSWANVAATYSAVTSDVHGGAEAQQISVTRIISGAVQLAQSVPVVHGNIYQFSVWLRGAAGTHVSVRLQRGVAPYDSFAETDVTLSSDWQLATARGYVTADSPGLAIIGVDTPGTVVIDDAALIATPGVPTPAPPPGPVSARFFGMHVANFLDGSLRNPSFAPPFVAVAPNGQAKLSGAIAEDWSDNSEWAASTVAYAADRTNPHGGKTDQKVTVRVVPSGAAQQLVQQLEVVPQQRYSFSAWLRGTSGASVNLVLQNANAPYNQYGAAGVLLSPTWTQASVSGLVGDTGQVLAMVQAAAPQTYFVADATMTDAQGKPVSGGVPWPTQPVGTLRLWDSGTSWHDLEPQKGVWNFAPLDAWVAAAAAHGHPEIILTLGQSPAWASARPNESNYYGAGAPAEPRSIADWEAYLRTVAQRYQGKIRYWEVWNEPNDPTYYTGTVAKLVQLTETASAVLKSVDPGNVVLTPAAYSVGYLDQFLAAGGARAADVVAFHAYATPPELTAPILANVRLVMAAHKIIQPLWESEGASGDSTTAAALDAPYLARKYLVDLAYGARRFDWYTWGPATPFCVATEGTDPARTPTAAGVAFGVLQSWLVGTTVTKVATDAKGTWALSLRFADGKPGAIVWNAAGTANATLPGGLAATHQETLAGVITAAHGNKVTATAAPVLYR